MFPSLPVARPEAVRLPDASSCGSYPIGTVAFLLSDLPPARADDATGDDVVASYQSLVREAAARYRGSALPEVGGADAVAFARVTEAMKCAAAIQRTVAARRWSVELGAAHGALAMTTPGDTSMASLAEVEKLMKGGGARVQR